MTLLMRDQENIEKGMEKGIEKGAIYERILVCRELDMPEKEISRKIQERFHISANAAEQYISESEQYEK